MNKKNILFAIIVGIGGIMFMSLNSCKNTGAKTITSPPNIILILADDLGTGDVNCYNTSSRIPTPNLDIIATQGVCFTDAHSNSAVCTPTRYGILTGRYSWRTRLKKGVLNGYSNHLIDPARTTIASLLKAKGYYTACIGKWHLGMDYMKDSLGKVDFSAKIENSPNVNGFDYFYGIAASLDFPPYVFIENDHFTKVPTETQEKLWFPRYLRAGKKADNFNFETAWKDLLDKASGVIDNHSSNGMFAIRNGAFKLVLGNGSGGRQHPSGTSLGKTIYSF